MTGSVGTAECASEMDDDDLVWENPVRPGKPPIFSSLTHFWSHWSGLLHPKNDKSCFFRRNDFTLPNWRNFWKRFKWSLTPLILEKNIADFVGHVSVFSWSNIASICRKISNLQKSLNRSLMNEGEYPEKTQHCSSATYGQLWEKGTNEGRPSCSHASYLS